MAEYLLSPQQRRIWLLQENTGNIFITKCCLRIGGSMDKDGVAAVLRKISSSQDMLRAEFVVMEELEFPLQTVASPDALSLSYDFFDREDSWSDEWLRELYEQDREFSDFFSSRRPGIKYYLVKRSSNEHYLIIKALSLLLDGYSLRQLAESILVSLNDGKGDADGSYRPGKISYMQFAEWQQRNLEDDTIRYWKETRFQSPDNLMLQTESVGKPPSPDRSDAFFMLPDVLKEKLELFTGGRQLTTSQFFYACWNILLSRLSGSREFISWYTDHGKDIEELATVWGALAKILPVRVSLGEDDDLPTAAAALSQELTDMEEWKDYFLLENSRNKDRKDDQPAFIPYLYEFLDLTLSPEIRQRFSPELLWFHSGSEKYKALLNVLHDNGRYRIQLGFDPGFFNMEEAKRMLSYFRHLVGEVLTAPERPVAELEILDEEEKHLILDIFNRRTLNISPSSIIELFGSQVRRNGDVAAVIGDDGVLTYRELNEEANRLAHFLRNRYQVKPGDVVALLTDRSTDLIKGVMGILKAGAAYLPLEASWPVERISVLLRESKCRLVITQRDLMDKLPRNFEAIAINDGEVAVCDKSDPPIVTGGRDLAYVIFTSGSTGKPKGVMIDHETVINLCYGLKQELGLSEEPGTRFSLFASAAFDASVQQIFSCLLEGNSIYIINDTNKKDIDLLTRFLRENRISVFDCTPAVLSLLLEEAAEEFRDTGVQKVLVGGDAWTDKLLRLFNKEGFDRPGGITFYNVYGPTECGVDSTAYRLKEGDGLSAIPIGTPLPNKHIYILDDRGKPVPIGLPGEIYIGGKGISPGYLNRDDLSTELFIPSPVNGERVYRSGDLGKWLPDGNIVFMGRKDEQLKIRGYRIEPAEVATALLGHEGVGEAVVYMSEKEDGQKSLIAAIVPDKKTAHTLLRIKALEEVDPDATHSLYKLPNGLPVWYANKSELELIYDEIFVDQAYLKPRITVKEGDIIFDVGANIGLFSLFMGLHYPGVRLYGFEPVGAVYDILQKNLSLYPIEYKIFNTGISDREGDVKFNYYPVNTVLSGRYGNVEEERHTVENYLRNKPRSNGHSLSDNDLKNLVQESVQSIEIDCRMRRLSDIIREEHIDRIDLLKIDVEKSEMDVINGIDEEDWQKIRQVVIEVHDRQGELSRIVNVLEQHGFEADIQQDPLLANTCLYNVYATRTGVSYPAQVPAKFEGWIDDKSLTGSIREYMAEKLPAYMLPADYFLISKIPLNSNGKVDREALKKLEGNTRTVKEIARPENEIESLLLKVWKGVLGRTDISVDDDFFMIGGDSIKAIQISSRLHKTGYKVTIRDILNHSILSDLVPHVKKIKKAILQDEIRGIVPLVPAQRTFFAQDRKFPNHFNLSMMFYSADRMDPDSIGAIFTKIWNHHDALRMVFTHKNGRWEQENRGTEFSFELHEYEFSGDTVISDAIQKEMETLQGSIDLGKGPLLKIGIFHTSGGDRLLVVIHHLVVDGVSWRILFEDIETLLQQYRAGISLKLPDKTNSFKEWAENLEKYANSNELLKEANYWAEIENEPVDYLDTANSKADNKMKDTAHIAHWLPAGVTSLLLTTANKVFDTKINDILLSALSISLRKAWGLSRVAITMEGHGREGILEGVDINRTVGWFTSLYPVVLYSSHEKDLPEQINEMKQQLNAIPNNGIGHGILKYLSDKKNLNGIDFRISPEISFNYLGQFDEDIRQLTMESSNEPVGSPFHQDDNRDHLLDIVAKVSSRSLNFQISYNTRHFSEEKIREFGEFYKATLISIAEHCAASEAVSLTLI
ncbi:MAG: amino acid adenylation domain-containing protein [Chitinophagaceae bacterium]|nr:amino acid adenylation domain-containing protein [Chitinophagaceae bacterium]